MLQKLLINHFRNYERQSLEFGCGVNALIGANGQGKTNILEAICYLSLLRSFRTTQTSALLNSGTGSFTLYGEVLDSQGNLTRLGVSHGQERRLVLNGLPVAKSSEFLSRLVCAPFLPEDLAIVKGQPAGRRKFLDIALCQLSPVYLRALQSFSEALKSRNVMLKVQDRYPRAVVTAYDQVLTEHAALLEIERKKATERLNEAVQRQSELFFPDGRRLALNFVSGIGRLLEHVPEDSEEVREKYRKALEESYERDSRDGSTHCGPQRSDLSYTLGGKSLSLVGSEGECRTAAIALRFALLELLRERRGPEDITVLVDDVLGELDATRRKAFLDQITATGQVVFAGTALPPEFSQDVKVFLVDRGSAQPQA